MPKPIISVVIASKNGERFLVECLSSVFGESGGNYEVIVVDDGSTDTSVALIKKHFAKEKRLRLVALPQNQGAAAARNIGVRNSTGRFLFFLDNDTKVKPGWATAIPAFFRQFPRTGLAQAKILKMNTNFFDYAGDFLSPWGFLIERARGAEDRGQFNHPDQIFGLKSAAMVAPRAVLLHTGGFDQDYHIFWEDTDLAWRTWLLGYEVRLIPDITVWHAYGTPAKDSRVYQTNQVVYRGCRNQITSLIKNLSLFRLLFTLPVTVGCWLVLSLAFLLQGQSAKFLAIQKGVYWNFAYLPKTLAKRCPVQKNRRLSDGQLFALTGSRQSLSYYLGKAKAYLTGRPF